MKFAHPGNTRGARSLEGARFYFSRSEGFEDGGVLNAVGCGEHVQGYQGDF